MRKSIVILIFISSPFFGASQEEEYSLLPQKKLRFIVPLIGASYEIRLSPNTSITPQIGFGFSYKSGTDFLNSTRFSEFGLIPQMAVDYKYYFKLTNKNRKGKVKFQFKGLYVSAPIIVSLQYLNDIKYSYEPPSIGTQINLGKAIMYNSNFYLNYYLRYTVFGTTIKTDRNEAESYGNTFGIGIRFGYTF